jgi:hypothetical protein
MTGLPHTYPRGVVLDMQRSATVPGKDVHPNALARCVYWLARSGVVYKTWQDAIADEGAAIGAGNTAALQPGERLLYLRTGMNHSLREEPVNDDAGYGRFYRVTCIESPFALPVSAKPSKHSTVWVGKNGKAYATYKEASKSTSPPTPEGGDGRRMFRLAIVAAVIAVIYIMCKKSKN